MSGGTQIIMFFLNRPRTSNKSIRWREIVSPGPTCFLQELLNIAPSSRTVICFLISVIPVMKSCGIETTCFRRSHLKILLLVFILYIMSVDASSRKARIIDTLNFLQNRPPKTRKRFIAVADKELMRDIGECCLNFLHGPIDLSTRQKEKLRKYLPALRKLSLKSCTLREKKKLVQSGGFLATFLPIAIELLVNNG